MSTTPQTNYVTGTRDPRRWWVLFACVLAVLTVALDSGMLTLLVPAIQNELDATQAQIGLMTSISALMLTPSSSSARRSATSTAASASCCWALVAWCSRPCSARLSRGPTR
jgi:cyanate permease